jgi:hypothetical protein
MVFARKWMKLEIIIIKKSKPGSERQNFTCSLLYMDSRLKIYRSIHTYTHACIYTKNMTVIKELQEGARRGWRGKENDGRE